jgi:hypothetical protein
MKTVELPRGASVEVEVIGGANNAARYTVALWKKDWDPKLREVGDGLASNVDPDPDTFDLGRADGLVDVVLLVRAFIFPYDEDAKPFSAGVIVLADGNEQDRIEITADTALTVNLAVRFALEEA